VTNLLKILIVVNKLDNLRLKQWSTYKEENRLDNLIYQDFYNFMKNLIKDPAMLQKEAALHYNKAA
jgi:hypothetical protein